MNQGNKFAYVIFSILLSLAVHLIVFELTRNIHMSAPTYTGEMPHKPSKYVRLGTVSLANLPKPQKRAELVPSHEKDSIKKLSSAISNSTSAPTGSKGSAGKADSGEGPGSLLALPDKITLPKPGTESSHRQNIIEIDGDKLSPERIQYNRLIIPRLDRKNISGNLAGASGGEGGAVGLPSEDSIPLKLRIPSPKKHNPGMPSTPDTRLLSLENTSILDSLMDVKISKLEEPDGSGFFQIDISPKQTTGSLIPFQKDIVFCIDSSGSISQVKLNEFRQGIEESIQKMRKDDRFEIISFKHKAFNLFGSLQPPTEQNLKKAEDFLFKLDRSGSTNIYSAIEPLTEAKYKTQGKPLIVFLASDGNVNAGQVSNSRNLINEISNRNQDSICIFTFSSGREKNSFLLDLMAYRNRGESMSLNDVDKSRFELRDFISDVSDILVMDLDYQVSSQLSDFTFPKKLPHLYSKHTLSLYGRFSPGTKDVTLRITGSDCEGKKQELVFAGNLENAGISDKTLIKKWAMQYIYHLYSKLTVEYDENLRIEIHRIAEQYGLDAPYLDKYLLQKQNYVSDN